MPATTPKITGLLHNCTLNCALPTLLEHIDSLAKMENTEEFTPNSTHPIIESYSLLKGIFADYYGILDKENFNFQQFSSYLKQHSFYANEIILAPIMREFIANKCEFPGDALAMKGIKRDGSYTNLHFSDAYHLFYKYFGINIKIYEFKRNEGTLDPQDNYQEVAFKPTITRDIAYPFPEPAAISLYFREEHYELQPHENLAIATELYNQELEELPHQLKTAHNKISFSTSERTTSYALIELKRTIYAELNSLPPEQLPVSRDRGLVNHSNRHFFIPDSPENKHRTPRRMPENDFNFAEQLSDLIKQHFGVTSRQSPSFKGIFGAYLLERSRVFEWGDFFSQCFSWSIGCCFGYKTEAEKRERYLHELLDTLIDYQNNNDRMKPVIDKIAQGKEDFRPRAQKGEVGYNRSLLAKLTSLETTLNRLERNRHEELAHLFADEPSLNLARLL